MEAENVGLLIVRYNVTFPSMLIINRLFRLKGVILVPPHDKKLRSQKLEKLCVAFRANPSQAKVIAFLLLLFRCCWVETKKAK